MSALGVDFGAPVVDIDNLLGHKEKVIGKLTGGLAAMAKMRKVTIVCGYGAFVGANHVEVEETDCGSKFPHCCWCGRNTCVLSMVG